MNTLKTNAFTLTEAVVVIASVAILGGMLFFHPGPISHVQVKGRQMAAASNVKQIVLACRLYAADNNGAYPTYHLDPTTLRPSEQAGAIVGSSNTAFAQLFPKYLTNESIFCEQGSAFTPTMADNYIDDPLVWPPQKTLEKGENAFAYCVGLTDKSNPLFPMVADGFNSLAHWSCVRDKTKEGGVWEGKKAIVGLVDGSASIMKVNAVSMTVEGNPVLPGASYFSTAGGAQAGQTWLAAPKNVWLNPKDK